MKATKTLKDEIFDLKNENDALAEKLFKTAIDRDWGAGRLRNMDSSTKKGLVNSKLSSTAHKPKPNNEADFKVMSRIDDIFTNILFNPWLLVYSQPTAGRRP